MRSMVSNFIASFTLSFLDGIYSKYERREELVDSETRASFIAKMGDVPEFSASLKGVASKAVQLATDYDVFPVRTSIIHIITTLFIHHAHQLNII